MNLNVFPDIVQEMVRYGVKGAGATIANIALMSALVELAAVPPEIAAIASTATLLIIGYQVMNRWVFPNAATPSSKREHLRRGVWYYVVILSGKAVNYALFVALLSLNVWYPAAWLLGSLTVFLGTFTANRWVWRGGVTA